MSLFSFCRQLERAQIPVPVILSLSFFLISRAERSKQIKDVLRRIHASSGHVPVYHSLVALVLVINLACHLYFSENVTEIFLYIEPIIQLNYKQKFTFYRADLKFKYAQL